MIAQNYWVKTIQSRVDNMTIDDISIKRKDKVLTFEYLLPTLKIGNSEFYITPLILFIRFIALMNSEDKPCGKNLLLEPTSIIHQKGKFY